MFKQLGCKVPWDHQSNNSFSVCSSIEKLKKYGFVQSVVFSYSKQKLFELTKCAAPCKFYKYTLVEGSIKWSSNPNGRIKASKDLLIKYCRNQADVGK